MTLIIIGKDTILQRLSIQIEYGELWCHAIVQIVHYCPFSENPNGPKKMSHWNSQKRKEMSINFRAHCYEEMHF